MLPVAPPLDDCDPMEYRFIVTTGGFVEGGFPWAPHVIQCVDLDGLDVAEYMANPVILWYHEPEMVIGRTLSLERQGKNLVAVARFLKTSRNAKTAAVLNTLRWRSKPSSWSASIGFQWLPFLGTRADPETNTLTFIKTKLIEWSICGIGACADRGAKALGSPTVLRVQG